MQNTDNTGPDYKLIAKRIQRQRAAIGFTQEKVADRTGLTVPTISNIENGKKKASLTSLYRIAHALKTPLELLVYGKPNPVAMKEEFSRIIADSSDTARRIITNVALLEKVYMATVAEHVNGDKRRMPNAD